MFKHTVRVVLEFVPGIPQQGIVLLGHDLAGLVATLHAAHLDLFLAVLAPLPHHGLVGSVQLHPEAPLVQRQQQELQNVGLHAFYGVAGHGFAVVAQLQPAIAQPPIN
mmetsp:Transcript_885/g.702  ORF Transcript_885/g.702 Transcript_885/m.702 type:complete len:108 (-) Transcript_885:31-354(-)